MSFLEHIDELRRRLIKCALFVVVATVLCWTFADEIFKFLEVPAQRALAQAQQRSLPVMGLTGKEELKTLDQLKVGDEGNYIFDKPTRMGKSVIATGTSVRAVVAKDEKGKIGLFTAEESYIGNTVVPEGIRLPADFVEFKASETSTTEKMVFTTALEPVQLYIVVSLYSGIAVSMPFLLFQVWGFISPALYPHEKKYVTPFVGLSSISFVLGVVFAYYVLFPPALGYLLGLGQDFTPILKATDYFDFITLIMLAMGVIFQMPAIAYVLSRIGLISAGFLLRSWKIALVVMLIVAAFVSPTGDIPNMMLFATPMLALYVVSIAIAWIFGKGRQEDQDDI